MESYLRILLAGTVHWDPICRKELRTKLDEYRIAQGEPPSFVAVEAGYDHFSQLEDQRLAFKSSARTDWAPDVSQELINELSLTMLYEADTTLEVFPNVDVVWLDRVRDQREPEKVSQYPETAASRYAPWIGERRESGAGFDFASTLTYLSSAMKLYVRDGPPKKDPARDAEWFDEMSPRLAKGANRSWAIVVCGVEHTLDEPGNRARLLLEDGHQILASLDLANIFS